MHIRSVVRGVFNINVAALIWGALLNAVGRIAFHDSPLFRLAPELVSLLFLVLLALFIVARGRIGLPRCCLPVLMLLTWVCMSVLWSLDSVGALATLYGVRLYILPLALGFALVLFLSLADSGSRTVLMRDFRFHLYAAVVVNAVASMVQMFGVYNFAALTGDGRGASLFRSEVIGVLPRAFGLTYGHVELAFLSAVTMVTAMWWYRTTHSRADVSVFLLSVIMLGASLSRSLILATGIALAHGVVVRRVRLSQVALVAVAMIIMGGSAATFYDWSALKASALTSYGLRLRIAGPWASAISEYLSFGALAKVIGRGIGVYGAASMVGSYLGKPQDLWELAILDNGYFLLLLNFGAVGVMLWFVSFYTYLRSRRAWEGKALLIILGLALIFVNIFDNPYMPLFWVAWALLTTAQETPLERAKAPVREVLE